MGGIMERTIYGLPYHRKPSKWKIIKEDICSIFQIGKKEKDARLSDETLLRMKIRGYGTARMKGKERRS
jgi:hypothetical protein